MTQCLLLAAKISWGSIPDWLTLITAIITIVATYIHFNRQPKELIHPIVTVNKPNDGIDSYVIKFWALNKSNVPVTVAFCGLRLAWGDKNEYDRLGRKFEFQYLQAGEKSKDYCFSLTDIERRFGKNVKNEEIIFCFETADCKYVEGKIKLNKLIKKLQ